MRMFSLGRGIMNYWILPKIIGILILCFVIPYVITVYIMKQNKQYPVYLKGNPYEL
jgi:hypothetical protein